MKKNERKALEVKLLSAIKKVIKTNKADLTNKAERVIKKALKHIAKNSVNEKTIVSSKK